MVLHFKRHAVAVAAAAALGLALASVPARAAGVNERGTVASVDGSVVKITTREGKTLSLDLTDGWNIAGVAKAGMADIKPGSYIGTATSGDDADMEALEVVVFPEAMRGTGEGHFPWDLQPNSMMTNANVTQAVKGVDGQTVTLSYKGGEKKVAIKDATPIVQIASATKDDIKPGVKVFIGTSGEKDGKLEKGTLVVGKDGIAPPM